jgi:hypothetical protein
MRRLSIAVAVAAVLALTAFSTAYAGKPSPAPNPQSTFGATWASLAVCTDTSYATPCSATAVASWQNARTVRAALFEFECNDDWAGSCIFHQPLSVTVSVPSSSNGSTALTFTWRDDCATSGYRYTVTFLDSRGRTVGSQTSDYIRNPFCS